MPTLLLQLNLKQWDKSQRSEADELNRNTFHTRHAVQSRPEFKILDTPCLLDQFALDFTQAQPQWQIGKQAGRPVKMGLQQNGSALLDRFVLQRNPSEQLQLCFYNSPQELVPIGTLAENWIEATYQWRYRTEVNQKIFWQYEEVTLNAALAEHYAEDFFLTQEPAQTFYKDLK